MGEVWFEHSSPGDAESFLLLKLLFTSQPLSVQVHPDDAMARSMGLPRGKSEAWYVLSAAPGAKIARGVRTATTPRALRGAIDGGDVLELIEWQTVRAGDVIDLPAGTIHALGADLVVAEVQQRCDTTFRLFDFGRDRPLDTERAVAAAHLTPAAPNPAPQRLTATRLLLLANPHFVFERFDLRPGMQWTMHAAAETWLLVIDGQASVGPIDLVVGEAAYLEREVATIAAGPAGLVALAGMLASAPIPDLLIERASLPASKANP